MSTLRYGRLAGAACGAGLAVVLAGCGGGSSHAAGTSPSASSVAPSASASGWEWAEDDQAPPSGAPAEAPIAAGTPSGAPAGSTDSTGDGTSSKTGRKRLDPCTLATATEWSAWSGATSPAPVALEYGEVCGWKNDADTVRMAIGAFEVDGGTRWSTEQQAPAGQSVSGLGDRATWLTHWPSPQASTLVVETAGWDLVVEMDSRGDVTDPALLAGATGFARTALPRLPHA